MIPTPSKKQLKKAAKKKRSDAINRLRLAGFPPEQAVKIAYREEAKPKVGRLSGLKLPSKGVA